MTSSKMKASRDHLLLSMHVADKGWKQAIDLLHGCVDPAPSMQGRRLESMQGMRPASMSWNSNNATSSEGSSITDHQLEIDSLRYDNDRLQRQAIALEQRMHHQSNMLAEELTSLLDKDLISHRELSEALSRLCGRCGDPGQRHRSQRLINASRAPATDALRICSSEAYRH